MEKYCSKCGAVVEGNFCARCGTPVQENDAYNNASLDVYNYPYEDNNVQYNDYYDLNEEYQNFYDESGTQGDYGYYPVDCGQDNYNDNAWQNYDKNQYASPEEMVQTSAVKHIYGIIMSIVFLIEGLFYVKIFLVNIRDFFQSFNYYGIGDTFEAIFSIVVGFFGLSGNAAMVYAMFLLNKDRNADNACKQFHAAILSGLVCICADTVAGKLMYMLKPRMLPNEILLVFIALAGILAIDFLEDRSYIKNVDSDMFGTHMKEGYRYLLSHKRTPKNTVRGNVSGGQNNINMDWMRNRNRSQVEYGVSYIDVNRTPLKIIVFSALTLGIYGLWAFYSMVRDVNTVCAADGEKTAGLIKYILVSIITCGAYSLVWGYKINNRIQRAGMRYNTVIDDDGGTYLLWNLVGLLFCGLGPFIAQVKTIQNCNKIFQLYNMSNENDLYS